MSQTQSTDSNGLKHLPLLAQYAYIAPEIFTAVQLSFILPPPATPPAKLPSPPNFDSAAAAAAIYDATPDAFVRIARTITFDDVILNDANTFATLCSGLDIKYGDKGYYCWSAFCLLVTALGGGPLRGAGETTANFPLVAL